MKMGEKNLLYWSKLKFVLYLLYQKFPKLTFGWEFAFGKIFHLLRDLAPVVQRADNFIHWIGRSAENKCVQDFPYSSIIIVYRVEAYMSNLSMGLCETCQKRCLEYICTAG